MAAPPPYPLLQQTRARRINGAGIFPPSLRKEDAEKNASNTRKVAKSQGIDPDIRKETKT
jgi:hypothetical protein